MNASLPKLFLALCLGAGTLALWGCKQQPEKPPKTEFVLFDLSGSTASPEIRARYVADFERLLATVYGGDVLVVDRITTSPLAQSTFPVNQTIKRMNPWVDNMLTWRLETTGVREHIDRTVKKMVLDPNQHSSQTSILDSLQLAQRVYANYPNQRRVLVLFSDMVEESSYYNFTKENLTASRIQEVIAAEKAAKRLARLDGAHVYVIGAGAGYYSNTPPETVRKIQNFWLAYFKACGASLPVETYGSALIRPPE
jgi:hypothetical protein